MAINKAVIGDDVLDKTNEIVEEVNRQENDIDGLDDIFISKTSREAFIYRGATSDANINNDTNNSGWYTMGGGSINVPNQYGTLIHFDRDTVSKSQIFIELANGKMHSRTRNSSGVWGAWNAL